MRKLIQKIRDYREKRLRKKIVFYLIKNQNHKPDLEDTINIANNAIVYINKDINPFVDASKTQE